MTISCIYIFNLEKKVTTKQFSDCNDSGDVNSENETVTKKMYHYLRHINNLSKYHMYFSRTYDANEKEKVGTITFIRK